MYKPPNIEGDQANGGRLGSQQIKAFPTFRRTWSDDILVLSVDDVRKRARRIRLSLFWNAWRTCG